MLGAGFLDGYGHGELFYRHLILLQQSFFSRASSHLAEFYHFLSRQAEILEFSIGAS